MFSVLVYCALIIFAFLGNLLVLFAVKKNRNMHASLWTVIWSVPYAVLSSLTHLQSWSFLVQVFVHE